MSRKQRLALAYCVSFLLNGLFWLAYGRELRRSSADAPRKADTTAALKPVVLGRYVPLPPAVKRAPEPARDASRSVSGAETADKAGGASQSTRVGSSQAATGASGKIGGAQGRTGAVGAQGQSPSSQAGMGAAAAQLAQGQTSGGGAAQNGSSGAEESGTSASGKSGASGASAQSPSGAGASQAQRDGQKTVGAGTSGKKLAQGQKPNGKTHNAPTLKETASLAAEQKDNKEGSDTKTAEKKAAQDEPTKKPKPTAAVNLKIVKMWTPKPGQKFNLASNLNIALPKNLELVPGPPLTSDQAEQLKKLLQQQKLRHVGLDRKQLKKLLEARRTTESKRPPEKPKPGDDARKRERERQARKPKPRVPRPPSNKTPKLASASMQRPRSPFTYKQWNSDMFKRWAPREDTADTGTTQSTLGVGSAPQNSQNAQGASNAAQPGAGSPAPPGTQIASNQGVPDTGNLPGGVNAAQNNGGPAGTPDGGADPAKVPNGDGVLGGGPTGVNTPPPANPNGGPPAAGNQGGVPVNNGGQTAGPAQPGGGPAANNGGQNTPGNNDNNGGGLLGGTPGAANAGNPPAPGDSPPAPGGNPGSPAGQPAGNPGGGNGQNPGTQNNPGGGLLGGGAPAGNPAANPPAGNQGPGNNPGNPGGAPPAGGGNQAPGNPGQGNAGGGNPPANENQGNAGGLLGGGAPAGNPGGAPPPGGNQGQGNKPGNPGGGAPAGNSGGNPPAENQGQGNREQGNNQANAGGGLLGGGNPAPNGGNQNGGGPAPGGMLGGDAPAGGNQPLAGGNQANGGMLGGGGAPAGNQPNQGQANAGQPGGGAPGGMLGGGQAGNQPPGQNAGDDPGQVGDAGQGQQVASANGGMAGDGTGAGGSEGALFLGGEQGDGMDAGENDVQGNTEDTGFTTPATASAPDLPMENPNAKKGIPGSLVLPPSPPMGTENGRLPTPRRVKKTLIQMATEGAPAAQGHQATRPLPPAASRAPQKQAKAPVGMPPKPRRKAVRLALTVGSTSTQGTLPFTVMDRPHLPIGAVSDAVDPPLPPAKGIEKSLRVAPKSEPSRSEKPTRSARPNRAGKPVAAKQASPPIVRTAKNSQGIKNGTEQPLPPTPLPDSDMEVGDGSGLKGEYYLGRKFDQYQFTRADPMIDFDWKAGQSPSPRIPSGTDYTIRWTGKIQPKYSQTYTLYATADDGVRVWINHKLIIDDWSLHAATQFSNTIPLQAGQQYLFKVEYLESAGGAATVQVYWESPSQPKEFIPENAFFYPLPGDEEDMKRDKAPL